MCLSALQKGKLLLVLTTHKCSSIYTRLGLKETTETQRCLCASQISHVSLLYHTDTSSQYSVLHEGQVPACCHRAKEGGRKRVVGKQLYVNQNASFLSLSTFPLPRIYIFPSHFIHSSFSLSLSPLRNPVSPLGLRLFEGDPELCCSLPPLSSLPTTLPPRLPSTPTPQPSGGLDPAQLRETTL